MQGYQILEETFKESKQRESWILEKIKDPKEKQYYTSKFEALNIDFALYTMYIEHDYINARKYFYTAARVAEYSLQRPGGGQIETTIQRIGYALFSDSKEIIERFSQIKTNSSNTWIGNIYIRSIQSVLIDDAEQLSFWTGMYEQRFAKKKEVTFMGCLEVLQGIVTKDIKQVELGITNLIKTHKKRPHLEYVDPYFCTNAATMAKLAWIKGLEVKVDNPLVPMELLPIQPLDRYEDAYEFLKE